MDNLTPPHMKTDTLHRILTFCALAAFSFSSPLSLAQSQPSAGHPSIPRLPIWPAGTIPDGGADTLGDPSVPKWMPCKRCVGYAPGRRSSISRRIELG